MGAPKGNTNATKAKPWEEALRKELAQLDLGANKPTGTALRTIAKAVISKAMEGDKDSIAEIANRLDGKPKQQIEGPGEQGEHKLEIIHKSE